MLKNPRLNRLCIAASLSILFIHGCKGQEALIPGTWKNKKKSTFTLMAKEDKTFSATIGILKIAGTWKIDAGDAVFTTETVQGKPVAQVIAKLQNRFGSASQKIQDQIHDLGTPHIFKLSVDGKMLVTDKTRDKNIGPPPELTKIP